MASRAEEWAKILRHRPEPFAIPLPKEMADRLGVKEVLLSVTDNGDLQIGQGSGLVVSRKDTIKVLDWLEWLFGDMRLDE